LRSKSKNDNIILKKIIQRLLKLYLDDLQYNSTHLSKIKINRVIIEKFIDEIIATKSIFMNLRSLGIQKLKILKS